MKNVKLIFSICFIIAFVISCQKTSSVVEPQVSQNPPSTRDDESDSYPSEYQYFIDDVQVTYQQAEANNPGNILAVAGSPTDPTNKIVQIRCYSTEEKEMQYAADQNIPLKKFRTIENHLSEYAITSGAVQYAEEHGNAPQSFLDYQEEYISQVMGRKSRSLLGWYRKDCISGSGASGATWIFSGTGTPIFCCNWNNSISGYYNAIPLGLGIYGYMSVYDKTFFKARLYEQYNYSNITVCFDSLLAPINDLTSSGFHI